MPTFLAILATIACLAFFPLGLLISLVASTAIVLETSIRELVKALKDTWA